MRTPRSILITGASSGIGAALAQEYAAPGMSLALSGRDANRLSEVAEVCRTAGSTVDTEILDVADASAMYAWVAATDAERREEAARG